MTYSLELQSQVILLLNQNHPSILRLLTLYVTPVGKMHENERTPSRKLASFC